MSLAAKLVVVGGEVKTAEIKLRLPSTIGRGRDSTIMLRHPLVSRLHCELFETDGQLMVRDLGSLNGTFINNQKITESALPPGELLTVGTVTFRAVYDALDSQSPPAAASPAERTVGASQATTVKAAAKAHAAADHHAGNGHAAGKSPAATPSNSDTGANDFTSTEPSYSSNGSHSDGTLEDLADIEEVIDPTSLGTSSPATETLDDVETIDDEEEDDLNDFLKNIK